MTSNFADINLSIKKNGYFLIKDFLDKKDILDLKKILDTNTKKNTSNSFIAFKKIDLFKSILRLDTKKIKKNYVINKVKNKYNLQGIASTILGKKNELYAIDSYKSEKNINMVIPWHTDQAYSGKKEIDDSQIVNPDKAALKFFFYLTDVDSDNGCLGYIPGSHKISYFLKKLILQKKIDYSPYWSLSDYRNFITTDNIKKNLLNFVSEYELNQFLKISSFITTDKKDTNLFDIPAKEGSLLIFDESGVHRGAALNKTDRLCLRYFFRKKI
tara:strand:- start:21 stop:833 length:813 start_codon:yes stop_codon:yes gene_type:complete